MIIPQAISQQQQLLQIPLLSSSLGLLGSNGLGFVTHSLQDNIHLLSTQYPGTISSEISCQQYIPLSTSTTIDQKESRESELMNEILFGDLDDLFDLKDEDSCLSPTMNTPIMNNQYETLHDMPPTSPDIEYKDSEYSIDNTNAYIYDIDYKSNNASPYSTRYSCVSPIPSSPIPILESKSRHITREFNGTLSIPSSPSTSFLSQSLPVSLEKREKNRLAAEKSRKKRQDLIKHYTESNMELRIQSKELQLRNEQLETRLDQLIQVLVANGISTIKTLSR